MGAAGATLISYFALNIVMSLILHMISGINPLTAGYGKPFLGSVVAGLIIYVFAKNLPLYSWMLPIYFILFVLGYAVALFLTKSVSGEDVALFDAVSKKTGLEISWVRKLVYRLAVGTNGDMSV